MKGLKTVLAVLGALAAIGAAIYVGITYGDIKGLLRGKRNKFQNIGKRMN